MITPPPDAFEGRFSEFFAGHVAPNLPSPERVARFDTLLRDYLAGSSPIHVLRTLRGQERGVPCATDRGDRILPGDNTPGWWLHAFLVSDEPMPSSGAVLFESLPTRMFEMNRSDHLNAAGFHLAHLFDVKNRDTAWHGWDRSELARRMRLNLHPCNWFLLATGHGEWQRPGSDRAVLAWVEHAHRRRYGATFEAFRRDIGRPMAKVDAPADPYYGYGAGEAAAQRQATRKGRPSLSGNGPRGRRSDNPRRVNRPGIWRDYVGSDVVLEINRGDEVFTLPHDELLAWVGENTRALESASWTEKGHYNWPSPSQAMRGFLQPFRTLPR